MSSQPDKAPVETLSDLKSAIQTGTIKVLDLGVDPCRPGGWFWLCRGSLRQPGRCEYAQGSEDLRFLLREAPNDVGVQRRLLASLRVLAMLSEAYMGGEALPEYCNEQHCGLVDVAAKLDLPVGFVVDIGRFLSSSQADGADTPVAGIEGARRAQAPIALVSPVPEVGARLTQLVVTAEPTGLPKLRHSPVLEMLFTSMAPDFSKAMDDAYTYAHSVFPGLAGHHIRWSIKRPPDMPAGHRLQGASAGAAYAAVLLSLAGQFEATESQVTG